MNNKFLITIIVVIIVGVGGYYFLSSRNTSPADQAHIMENMDGKRVTQSHRSYEIEVLSSTDNVEPNKSTQFRYRIKNDKGEIIKAYEIAHEKIMHFITVRQDLQYFQHLHPDLNQATGEFTINITFPTDGPYRVFPDFTPTEDNPQKLPVTVYHDVEVGNSSKYYAQSVVPDTEIRKKYGEYAIVTTFPEDAKKQIEITYTLDIYKKGEPVTNLENYLGALGHSVILKEGTLDFIHTHAGETGTGPEIEFSTTFPESGIYKIFTQFQHEGNIQTVDYVIKVN